MVQGVEAQTGKVYTTDMGLSSSLINQIFQDQQGFVWVATEYGLNKFDGLRFTNYRHVSGPAARARTAPLPSPLSAQP